MITEEIIAKDTLILTVDVFDTILMRIVSPNDALTAIIELINDYSSKKFSQRIFDEIYNHVAHENRKNKLDHEVHWNTFLEALSKYTELEQTEIEKCFLLVEKMLTVPNFELIRKLKQIKESTRVQIYFISDIYYSSEFLTKVFSYHNISNFYDSGFTSGDFGLLKKTGNLFDGLSLINNWPLNSSWTHVGDCLVADHNMPILKGIDGKQFLSPKNLQLVFNRKVLKKLVTLDLLTDDFKFITELGLLKPVKTASDLSDTLMTTMLYGYFSWLVKDLKEKNINKVLFVSREGKILKVCFDIFCKIYNYDFESIYFYCSRKVALNFSFSTYTPEMIANVQANGGYSLLDFFNALNPPGEVKLNISQIDSTLFDSIPRDNLYQRSQYINRLLCALEGSDWMIAVKNQQRLFGKYLAQLGVTEGARIAFCDIGWGGQIQHNLSLGFDRVKKTCALEGYYFFTNESAESRQRPGSYFHSYLSNNPFEHWTTSYTYAVPQLLEMFIRAPHGTVLGFECDYDGNINPCFKSDSSQSRKAELLSEKLCKDIFENLSGSFEVSVLRFHFLRISATTIELLNRYLIESITKFPTKEFSLLLSNIINVADLGSESQTMLIADPAKSNVKIAFRNSIFKTAFLRCYIPFSSELSNMYFCKWYKRNFSKSVYSERMRYVKITNFRNKVNLNHRLIHPGQRSNIVTNLRDYISISRTNTESIILNKVFSLKNPLTFEKRLITYEPFLLILAECVCRMRSFFSFSKANRVEHFKKISSGKHAVSKIP